MHDPLPIQEKGGQQTTHATVAVEKGMDRFKLVVDQGTINEHRQFCFVVKVTLQIPMAAMAS